MTRTTRCMVLCLMPGFHAEIAFIAIDRLAFPEEIDPAVMQRCHGRLDPAGELPVFVHENVESVPNCDAIPSLSRGRRSSAAFGWSPREVFAGPGSAMIGVAFWMTPRLIVMPCASGCR